MNVRPFRVAPRSLVNAAIEAISRMANAWASEWFQRPLDVQCHDRCLSVDERSRSDWRSIGNQRHTLFCRISTDLERKLEACALGGAKPVAGSERPSRLATEALDEAIVDLLTRLFNAAYSSPGGATGVLHTHGVTLPMTTFEAGNEYVSFSLMLAGENLPMLLAIQPVKTVVASRHANRVGFIRAAKKTPLRLTAQLGEVRIEVGALQALAVGDILNLEKALHASVELVISGSAVARGYLASESGSKCIVIAS